MPRFYFDFFGDGPPRFDRDGSELPDRLSAGDEALAVLPEIAKGLRAKDPEVRRTIVARVRDASGTYFFEGELTVTARWLV